MNEQKNTKQTTAGKTRIKSSYIAPDQDILLNPPLDGTVDEFLELFYDFHPDIYHLIKNCEDLESARNVLYSYTENAERDLFRLDNHLHDMEKATVREGIRALKSIIGPINEYNTEFSALEVLWNIFSGTDESYKEKIKPAFVIEFIYLFQSIKGKSTVYSKDGKILPAMPEYLLKHGREAAAARMEILDGIGAKLKKYFDDYPSGLEENIIQRRKENKQRILDYFKAGEDDWYDYQWHLKHVITSAAPLLDLIEMDSEHTEAVKKAVKHKIPFGITPYYLHLMDQKMSVGDDHAVRAQVIPPLNYVDMMVQHRTVRDITFDFMGEHDTSPVDLITRRYPGIAIVKPFNTCAQICVYCQRNWEITGCLDPQALASRQKIEDALKWLDEHKAIGDVLITGGDPMIMKNDSIRRLLEVLSKKEQVYRIRLGTRTPVVMPMRYNDELMKLLEEFHNPPRQEISIVTHFEHSYEVTPEAFEAVNKIRKLGISVYNQEVFTIENSRRFETAKLRRDLKSIGIDPYYNFNMKGKHETERYMVPLARILQERKEEARLLPGLDRTDEPVFNVPRMGKNHLRSWQDHRLIMILSDGSRVYEFHPWEKNISAVPVYNYTDSPIWDYLKEISSRGENISDYHTIWYYF